MQDYYFWTNGADSDNPWIGVVVADWICVDLPVDVVLGSDYSREAIITNRISIVGDFLLSDWRLNLFGTFTKM